MRTIEESIDVLEKWCKNSKRRLWSLRTYPNGDNYDGASIAIEDYSDDYSYECFGYTIQEALDKAASEVEVSK